jgi:U3 small nucleolar RNA-associated protein 5
MPDLVARLSGLHSILTSRLNLQHSLLSLSGRLDIVLSQIEMRSSVAPAPITGKPASTVKTVEEAHYVEGESEDEDAQMDVEVEVNSDDEDGEVEDIELGGSSQEELEEDDDDDEEEEEEEEDDDPTMNGFIDDEADEVDEDFSDEEDNSE